jgi:hypothetical protein
VEPVYTVDADIVVIGSNLARLAAHHSLNAMAPESQLFIQFTTDERYQAFLDAVRRGRSFGSAREGRAPGGRHARQALGVRRRLSKRKKDELDLIRLAEAYPDLKSRYPAELREQLDRG